MEKHRTHRTDRTYGADGEPDVRPYPSVSGPVRPCALAAPKSWDDGGSVSRRSFLRTVAATALFPALVPRAALGRGAVAPSNRITLGFIGTGGHGINMNLKSFLAQPDAEVVALCDVDMRQLDRARNVLREHQPKADPFTTQDWREVIARDDVDAVVISTPDHWHVLPAIAAVRAGKDVHCEKPLTLTVHEGRVLSDTVRAHGCVFQTASENRSKWNFLRAVALVRNGRIGRLHTIRTELPAGHSVQGDYPPIQTPQPVPKGFDYDMWLGPAPWAPYTPGR